MLANSIHKGTSGRSRHHAKSTRLGPLRPRHSTLSISLEMEPRFSVEAPDRSTDRLSRSEGLAADRNDLALKARCERADPGRESSLEGLGVDQHTHAPKPSLGWNAVRQLQTGPEPHELVAAIQCEVAWFKAGSHVKLGWCRRNG